MIKPSSLLTIQKDDPVVIAVEPLKTDAVERAEKEAKKVVENVKKTLAENENDLNKVAPYPSGFGISRLEYSTKLAKYNLYNSLTRWKEGHTVTPHSPNYVYVDSAKVQKFIKKSKEDAALQYDAFVLKLTEKIGPTRSAILTGNHVWSWSLLEVVTKSGEKQIWKTQQITNVSKLGRLFYQWPTRKVKSKS